MRAPERAPPRPAGVAAAVAADAEPDAAQPDLRRGLCLRTSSGRAEGEGRGPRHGRGQRWVPMSEWKVLLRDRLPAYIGWERYLANLERLEQNRSLADVAGHAARRRGAADGPGGLRHVRPTGCTPPIRASPPRITRATRHLQTGDGAGLPRPEAAPVDDLVARQVLRALEPAALELSLPGGRRTSEQERGAPPPPLGAATGAGAVRVGAGRAAVPGGRAGEPPGGPDAGAALGGGPARSAPTRRRI